MKISAVLLCLSALFVSASARCAQTQSSANGLPNFDVLLSSKPAAEASGPALTLDEIERMALLRNPEIAVAARRVAMAEASVPAAGALDDPQAMYRGWGVPLSQPWNYNQAQNMFMLTQALPGLGKRSLRTSVADSDVTEAKDELASVRLRVRVQVRKAFYDLFEAQDELRIHDEHVSIAQQAIAAARIRYTVGQVPQQDLLKAQLELTRLAEHMIRFDRDAEVARARLNTLAGRDPDTPLRVEGAYGVTATLPTEASLEQLALQVRPDLLEAETAAAKSRQQQSLAKKAYVPDFTVSAGYMLMPPTQNIRNNYMVEGSMTLPWLDHRKHEAEIATATATVTEQDAELAALRTEAFGQIKESLAEAEAAQKFAALYQNSLRPQAEATLHAAVIAYENNQTDFLNLLDSQIRHRPRLVAGARGFQHAHGGPGTSRRCSHRPNGNRSAIDAGGNTMNNRNYRNAFLAALFLCLLLGGSLAWTLLHRARPTAMPDLSDPVVAAGPSAAKAAAPLALTQSGDGPALAPIRISPQRLQQIGVTTAVAQLGNVNDQLQVPGNVDVDEERLAYVQTRFPGWIQNVFANATWQYVRKGQRLFTIYSPDLVSTEQEYLLAKQNQKSFAPAMQPGSMPGMTAGAGSTAAQESGWLVQAAEERLRQFDVPPAEIDAFVQSGEVQREIAVVSPASGYITERNALPNAYVQPDRKLYTIAELSTVWVYANVFQTDVGRLKPGDPAEVRVDSYPGRAFRGRIDQVLPDVDPATRTARVRLVFGNPGLVLKPGVYVSVDIDIPLGRQLVIPASGVLQAGTREIAFIDRGQGNLEPRVIQTGAQIDDSVIVLSGLKPGDRIVSSANFLVDSEAQLQSAIGSFSPLPQPAATGSNPSANQSIQIDLSTDPSTPRKGANTVRVRLTGSDGKPITGAQVTATFFMAAMPAMGMGAMRTTATLPDQGQGMYSGPLQLGSGGTWQVTVTVAQNGQTIATKQLSLTASGGM